MFFIAIFPKLSSFLKAIARLLESQLELETNYIMCSAKTIGRLPKLRIMYCALLLLATEVIIWIYIFCQIVQWKETANVIVLVHMLGSFCINIFILSYALYFHKLLWNANNRLLVFLLTFVKWLNTNWLVSNSTCKH